MTLKVSVLWDKCFVVLIDADGFLDYQDKMYALNRFIYGGTVRNMGAGPYKNVSNIYEMNHYGDGNT